MLAAPFDSQLQPDSLLEADVFRKVFRINLSMLAAGQLDASMFQEVFEFGSVTQPDEPSHGWILDRDEAENAAGSGGGAPIVEQDGGPLAVVPVAPVDPDQLGGDMLIAAFGLAGLNAVQQSQSRPGRERARQMRLGAGLPGRRVSLPDLTAPM
ncbi:MAG: hypothetical protein JNK59_00135 [Sterolibacteriaceae bacterium]|nr:hypothetical protein [Sterolibacteriaceae bacterium]